LRGAAVLGAQRLQFVVDLPPGGVVTDVVPDGKCGTHVSPLSRVEAVCPLIGRLGPRVIPSQDTYFGNKYLRYEVSAIWVVMTLRGESGPDVLGSCFVLRVGAEIPHRPEGVGTDAHAARGRRSQDQAAG